MNHNHWCQSLFNALVEGGHWGVPRSGLVFTRRGEELVLTDQMPWMPEIEQAFADGLDVPGSAEELFALQEDDYESIRSHFAEAGITVTRAVAA